MKDKERSCIWLYAGIAAAMFVGMVIYSGFQEFWYDEVYQIGLVGSGLSIGDVFTEYTRLKDYTPPLYALISYFWIRIVPFSFRYLLLISEIMTAVGVFVTALAAKRTSGRKMGLLAEIFAVTSSVLILAAGYEFRAYALYFMATAFVLYTLAGRVSGTGKSKALFYTLSLVLLLYSHYYGSIIVGVLFLLDLGFMVARKQKFTAVLPYFISGLCFLPWLVLVFFNRTRSITEFWIQPPDLQSVFQLIGYLCSENEFLAGIFCLGLVGCLVNAAYKVTAKKFDYSADAMEIYVPGILAGVVIIMFLYGSVINPSGGIFYNRYFTGILPCCFWIMAYGTLKVWNRFCPFFWGKEKLFLVFSITLFLVTFVKNGNTFMNDIKKEQTISYTASVKELSRKEDIREPDTVVVTSDNPCVSGGVRMYFEKLFHTEVKVISQHDETFAGDIKKYKKIYVFHGKQPVTGETKEILSRYKQISRDRQKRITEYGYPETN